VLWNAVEAAEKRKDAQIAREFHVSLPREFDLQEQIEVVRKYVKENFVDKGMCADIAIHDTGEGNPHAHVMLTTRNVSRSGFGNKNRDWNKVSVLEEWREQWEVICNERLQEKGLDERIDHRTLKAQGIDREPTIPEGRNPEKIKYNQEVRRRNRERAKKAVAERLDKLIKEYGKLDDKIAAAKTEKAEKNQETQYFSARIERIEKYVENIALQDKKLDDLRTKRRGMWSKKEIDKLIERQEQSCKSARNHFKHKFHIAPEQAPAELERLGAELEAWQKRTIPDIKPLIDFHKEIEQEYKRVHLAVELRHDKQEVFAHMERLKRAESIEKCLERTRIERKLNSNIKERETKTMTRER